MKIGYRDANNDKKSSMTSNSLDSKSFSNSDDSLGKINILYANPSSDTEYVNSSDFGTYDKSEENNNTSINLDCYSNLKDKRLEGACSLPLLRTYNKTCIWQFNFPSFKLYLQSSKSFRYFAQGKKRICLS